MTLPLSLLQIQKNITLCRGTAALQSYTVYIHTVHSRCPELYIDKWLQLQQQLSQFSSAQSYHQLRLLECHISSALHCPKDNRFSEIKHEMQREKRDTTRNNQWSISFYSTFFTCYKQENFRLLVQLFDSVGIVTEG